jgi:hypothetical protein
MRAAINAADLTKIKELVFEKLAYPKMDEKSS